MELRGAGRSSRQVRNFGTPDHLDAGAIIACEVITPDGNWSSYPAHKHDEASETESELEEIYYFEIAAGPQGQPGLGFMRTSSSPGHADRGDRGGARPRRRARPARLARTRGRRARARHVLPERDGRPAPPGRRGRRAWLISDHPDQTWVRGTWADQDVDPMTDPGGLLDGQDREDDRRPGHRSTSSAPSTASPTASSRSSSPAASASSATATSPASARRCCRPSSSSRTLLPYVLGRNEQAMVHTRRRVRADEGPHADLGRVDQRRPGRDEHGHRRRAGDHQPAAGAAAAGRHVRRPVAPRRCCRSSSSRTPATSRSTTPSARSRTTSTASGAPSSSRPRC